MDSQTIFALATPQGKSGVAVIRISGEKVPDIINNIFTKKTRDKLLAIPNKIIRSNVLDIDSDSIIDDALAVYFKAPLSFTGEDILELHIHGSIAIQRKIFEILGKIENVRTAEAGEFSRRAFINGKMDLTEAEGLADLIDSETEMQRKQAFRQMGGALLEQYEEWRSLLIRNLAHIEAYIDFAEEEEGIPQDVTETIYNQLIDVISRINQHLDDGHRGERLRNGFYIAIIGSPNVGKSSLLNQIVQREAAIVSQTAGTTRDIIEVHLDIGGYPVIIADTAGLRETADEIEIEGINRALKRAEEADLNIIMLEAGESINNRVLDAIKNKNNLVVMNKIDITTKAPVIKSEDIFYISAKTGQGLSVLIDAIEKKIKHYFYTTHNSPLVTRQRYRESLEKALNCLQSALNSKDNLDEMMELIAEDIRMAARHIGRITGRIEVDEVLDVIFNSFCIGK